MSSSVQWFAKVEYQTDQTEAVINCSWIMDLEEDQCPAFDPHLTYRGFWSPIESDTPELMLQRVPQIPILSERDEKVSKSGYYRISILSIVGKSEDHLNLSAVSSHMYDSIR